MSTPNTTKPSKPFTIFSFIEAIIKSKPKWDTFSEDQKLIYNSYIINKTLSMNPKYLDIVNYVQKLNIKDNERLYKVYCDLIPVSTRTYFPFVKSNKTSLKYEEIANYVSQYYGCSLGEADEYVDMLKVEGVTDILQKSGLDDKTVKKLIKSIK